MISPKLLVCDRRLFRLSLWRDETEYRLVRGYDVAIGAVGHRTTPGAYKVTSRAKNPDWYMPDESWVPEGDRGKVVPGLLKGKAAKDANVPSGTPNPDNPIKSRWLGIADGIGIHGTDQTWSIGRRASHGCIRLSVEDVEDLFDRVSVGTPIVIT